MKHLDKVFQEKLANHQLDVPAGLWNKIEAEIEEKSSRPALMVWIIMGALILLSALAIYHFTQSDEQKNENGDVIISMNESIISNDSAPIEETILAQGATEEVNSKKQVVNAKPIATKKAKVSGTPADIIITKSYIGSNGAVVKQANLKKSSEFKTLMNSKANSLNASALIRMVEPIEQLPSPSFEGVKKKTINISL